MTQATPLTLPSGTEATYYSASEPASGGLKPSLFQALRTGFSVFATLSPEERSELQLRTRKQSSFRKLAATHGLPASTLWRSLAVYLLYRRCPEISRYRHVGISHISLILGLEEEAQLRFLHKAELSRWSRQQLSRELKRYRVRPDLEAGGARSALAPPPGCTWQD